MIRFEEAIDGNLASKGSDGCTRMGDLAILSHDVQVKVEGELVDVPKRS